MTVSTRSEMMARRNYGVEVELPDYGDIVRIRAMDATFFLKTGRIPDFLASTVQEFINSNISSVVIPRAMEKTEEWLTWLDSLVEYTFVSPKVVKSPQAEDEIALDEISYSDKLYIYTLFGQPAFNLRRFRKKQVEPVASVDAAKANGRPTIERPKNPAVVEPVDRTP